MLKWLRNVIRSGNPSGNPFDDPRIPLAEGLALGWSRPSPSGFAVRPDTVLGIPAVKRAAQLISGHIARLDIRGFRIAQNGSRVPAIEHPVYDLLSSRPSPMYSDVDWKIAIVLDVLLRGNSYTWIIRDDATQEPEELIRLEPNTVEVVVHPTGLAYVVRTQSGEKKYILGSDMLQFKGMGNGIVGISIIDTMIDALGLAGAVQRFAGVYFANNCTPGMMLEYTAPPKGTEDKAATIKAIENLAMGLDRSHRTAVIPYGYKLADYSVDAESAQLLASRQFTLIDMANAIGISAQKLGAQISTNYNSLESERKAFLEDLEMYLVSIEKEINYKLLSESDKRLGRIYYQFDRSAMEMPDAKTQEDIWTDRLNNGKITFNEFRQATDQSTVSEPWADLHRMPSNLVYAEQAAEPPPPPVVPTLGQPPEPEPDDGQEPDEQDTEKRYRQLIGLDVDRMAERLRKASKGKPASWYDSPDFIGHRDVFVRSIPWGETVIDDFLSGVIEAKSIDDAKIHQLKEALWTNS